jgi:hypothetical protein
MCSKIRCDGWKRKYFGFACQVNTALADWLGAVGGAGEATDWLGAERDAQEKQ